MNAKELLAAANELIEHVVRVRGHKLTLPEKHMINLSAHVIATMREDDHEIATRQWAEHIYTEFDCVGSKYEGCQWVPEFHVNGKWVRMKVGATRGQVRSLLRALGCEVKA